jgi:hypothetical protein
MGMIRADYRDMNDDEKAIGKGYMRGQSIALICVLFPGIAFWFGGEKLAVYFGFIAIVLLLNEAVGRLHDLAIRLSRTNELLVDGNDERGYRKAGAS